MLIPQLKKFRTALPLLAALASPSVWASSVQVDYQGAAYGYKYGNIYADFQSGHSGLESKGAAAGGFKMLVGTEDSPMLTQGDTIVTWCVDIFHSLITSTPRWVDYGVAGEARLAQDFNSDKVGKLQELANQRYAQVDTKTESAAFQLAIWEILFENSATTSIDWNSGNTFYATGFDSALSLARDWLRLDGAVTGNYRITYLYDAVRGDRYDPQNLITLSEVPLPGAALLMLTALGFGAYAGRSRIRAA